MLRLTILSFYHCSPQFKRRSRVTQSDASRTSYFEWLRRRSLYCLITDRSIFIGGIMIFVTVKGTRVPALGFGTWQLTGSQCESAVAYALELGYRHVDTAQAYGNEREVGRAIKQSTIKRDAMFLTTKIAPDNVAPKDLSRSLTGSLDALGTDYVDLLLIHWPSATVKMDETLQAMNEAKGRGQVKHIGVSNFTVAHMREAIEMHKADVVCNQIEYHALLGQNRVIDFARAHAIMVTAYCPLARGRIADQPALATIAKRHG